MTQTFSIRGARRTDAEQLAQLSGQLGYPADGAQMAARLHHLAALATHWVAVAEQAGTLLGWLHVGEHLALERAPQAEIYGLVTAACARRVGVGRRLVAAAEDWSRRAGYGELTVRSNALRTEAHHFYPALGFSALKSQQVYRKTLTQQGPA